jgi:hypothetical protein
MAGSYSTGSFHRQRIQFRHADEYLFLLQLPQILHPSLLSLDIIAATIILLVIELLVLIKVLMKVLLGTPPTILALQ